MARSHLRLVLLLAPAVIVASVIATATAAHATEQESLSHSVIRISAAEHKVTNVTVYSDFAEVRRRITLPPLNTDTADIILEDLSSRIRTNSFRTEVVKGHVSVISVSAFLVGKDTTAASEEQQALQRKLEDINQEIGELDERKAELKAMNAKLAQMTPEAAMQWHQLSSNARAEILAARAALVRQRAAVEADIAVVTRKSLREQAGRVLRTGTDASISLEVTKRGASAVIDLIYLVGPAYWQPAYDVHVDTAARKLKITMFGEISQQTGEDWDSCTLNLSTSSPESSSSPPDLGLQTVDWYRHVHFGAMPTMSSQTISSASSTNYVKEQLVSERESSVKRGKVARQLDANGFNVGGGTAEAFDAMDADDGAMDTGPHSRVDTVMPEDTMLRITRSVRIASSTSVQRLAIAEMEIDATFEYVAIPAKTKHVFIKAHAVGQNPIPLLPSYRVNIFSRGTFLANGTMPYVALRTPFQLYLGSDHDIQLTYSQPLTRHSKSSGLFTAKSEKHRYDFMTTVRSAKTEPVRLSVIQQLPLSKDDRIVVTLEKPQPSTFAADAGKAVPKCPPNSSTCTCIEGLCFHQGVALNDRQSHVTYSSLLEPMSELRLPFSYVIEWPSDDPHHTSGIQLS